MCNDIKCVIIEYPLFPQTNLVQNLVQFSLFYWAKKTMVSLMPIHLKDDITNSVKYL